MFVIGVVLVVTSVLLLYLKYRVVVGSEKCRGKIVDIHNHDCHYVIKGMKVKKKAYIVKIKNKNYYTAHGCLVEAWGKKKIGKEILVYKNEKYGQEVFAVYDFRIELFSLFLVGLSFFFI